MAAAALHHAVDSTARCAKLCDDEVTSSTDFAKPVYLVAQLLSEQPAYSVFKVDAAAAAGGDDPLPARTVAELPGGRKGMSFVTVHSEQGSWIVGVGGLRGGTVIYDPSTMKTFRGPQVSHPKRMPILISLQSKVYAISRHPSVRYKSKFDFEPWFESLSFRKGAPCIYGDDCPYWKPLPPPPFFPYLLDPLEYRNPPIVSVSSYAAIGSHILLSLDCKEMGTYAFDVVKKTWEKVCDESLPFVGQAVHLGGSLFVACSTTQHNVTPAAALFHMSITSSSTLAVSGKLTTNLLSVLEYPVAAEGYPLPLFCSMGKGSFCSISLGSCPSDDTQIILTSFEIQNVEAILAAFQTESTKAKDIQVPVQVKHQNQIYKLHGSFKNLPMPVIASLSMNRNVAELFEGKRIKTRARKSTTSNIFDAVVIRRRA